MKNNQNEGKNMAVAGEVGRLGYEASVMKRMQGRSGAYTPSGSKGIAHEIMANDRANLNNLLKPGTITQLTKSPNAPQVDAVTMKGGNVLERIQYKDTTSPSGLRKTMEQAASGKYRQAQLKGTKETAAQFNQLAEKMGITKRMQSTGISSDTTQHIGNMFTGKAPTLSGVGNVAKSSATMAAGLTAGVEIVKSVVNGDSAGECVSHVVSKTAESAITAAASTAAAEATLGAATALLATSAVPVIGPLVAAGAVALGTGAVVGGVTDGLFEDIGDGIGDVVEDIGYEVGNFVDDIGYGVESLVDGIGDGIEEVVDGIGDAISDALFDFGCFLDCLF